MGSFRLLPVFAFGFLGLCVFGVASEEQSRPGDQPRDASRFIVDLQDGTRLVGTATEKSLKIASESFGEMDVPISVVRTIERSGDGTSVTLITSNGEKLLGSPKATALKLDTPLGQFSLPLKQVTRIAATARLLASPLAAKGELREGYYLLNLVENGVSVEKGALLNILIKDNVATCVNSSAAEYINMSGRIWPTGNNGFKVRFPHGTQDWVFSNGEAATVTEVPDRGERQMAIRVADESLREVEKLNELLQEDR